MDLTGVVRTPQSLGSKAPAGAHVAASRCDCWTSASSWRSKGQWKGWHGGPAVFPLPCAGHLASPSSAAWELEEAQVRALGGSWAQRHAPAPGSKTPGGQGHAILGGTASPLLSVLSLRYTPSDQGCHLRPREQIIPLEPCQWALAKLDSVAECKVGILLGIREGNEKQERPSS